MVQCSRCNETIRGNSMAERLGSLGEAAYRCAKCFRIDAGILGSKSAAREAWESEGWEF